MREDHLELLEKMFPRGFAIAFVREDGEVDFHFDLKEGMPEFAADVLKRFLDRDESGEEWKRNDQKRD
jgi:hypothetical protein